MIKYFENRQSDYTDEYEIEFRWEATKGFFTLWCKRHPPDRYGKGVKVHHLYSTGQICQTEGYEPRTLEVAEARAYWWMKRWSIYVRTGEFPMTPDTIEVPD